MLVERTSRGWPRRFGYPNLAGSSRFCRIALEWRKGPSILRAALDAHFTVPKAGAFVVALGRLAASRTDMKIYEAQAG